ncbi:hypothetical protein ACHAP5_000113 [Fusarium lateritium]
MGLYRYDTARLLVAADGCFHTTLAMNLTDPASDLIWDLLEGLLIVDRIVDRIGVKTHAYLSTATLALNAMDRPQSTTMAQVFQEKELRLLAISNEDVIRVARTTLSIVTDL